MFVEFIPSFQSNWVNGNETALWRGCPVPM
jgi:hypothetical protein